MSGTAAARRILATVCVALAAGAWALVAVRLGRTSVPGDLGLPRLDEGDYFSDALLDEASGYTRFLDLTDMLAAVALLVAVAVFAVKGARFGVGAEGRGRATLD